VILLFNDLMLPPYTHIFFFCNNFIL